MRREMIIMYSTCFYLSGIPGYNYYRQYCGLQRADNFSSLIDHSTTLQQALESIYSHVDDIDLFTGGVTER